MEMVATLNKDKPKLLLFRSIRPNLPRFILDHFDDQEDCLRQHFELHVVSDAVCDLDELCDRYHPELLMFESGVYVGERTIRNARAHSEIPRIGFCNSDAYCLTRSIFLSDMDRWGVETFFTHAISMPSYTPEIADRMFLWPNFINPKRFTFDSQPKDIPVLLTGSRASHYPWRNAVARVLSERFPATTTPHFGWFDANATSKMVIGEAYLKLLARSTFVPTCGSIARDALRKHFEIPAAGACLIAERTQTVEAAGYMDMQNCVFADESDVLDKVTHLLSHPQELDRITRAGQELVQRKHTMRSRTQVADWLSLHQQRRPGERIIQADPFGPLELVTDVQRERTAHLNAGSEHIAMIRNGLGDIGRNDLRGARAKLARCNNWHFTSEAALGIALCFIRDGRPWHAVEWIWQVIDRGLSMNALDPDPVEWATLIRALLCAGSVREARRHSLLIPWVRHNELDRMRQVVQRLGDRTPPPLAGRRPRSSVHVVQRISDEEWRAQIIEDLLRCRQKRLGERVSAMHFEDFFDDRSTAEKAPTDEFVQRALGEIKALQRARRSSLRSAALRLSMRLIGPPERKLQPALVRWALKRFGVETPEILGQLAATADYRQIVLHGASVKNTLADAVLAAATRNPNLYFEDPIVTSVENLQPGMHLFVVVGKGGSERVDVDVLIERAEVVVLSGISERRRSELVSRVLASKRFVVPTADTPVGTAILRRSATGAGIC